MKNFVSPSSSVITNFLVMFLLFMASCNNTEQPAPDPIASTDKDAAARKWGDVSINSEPPGGCPSGTTWDPVRRQCVQNPSTNPVINSYGDVDRSKITFFSSSTYQQQYPNSNGGSVYITPGSTFDGKKYYYLKLYKNGIYINEELIIGIKKTSTTQNAYSADYFDKNGKRFGTMTILDSKYQTWNSGFTGTVDGTGFTSRGFWGNWGGCVVRRVNYMFSGTLIGTEQAISCMIYGPECAAIIGLACALESI